MFEIIKKYYQWLFSFSKNVEKDELTESITETEKSNTLKKCLCSIDFCVNVDNTMDIVCHWPNLDDLDEETINAIAAKYAVLLHAINFGIVSQDVTSTLSDNLESNNPSDRYFVYEVLSKMVELGEKRKSQYSYDPVIKPSDVFKYYNNLMQK
jgi:hypothetical protein